MKKIVIHWSAGGYFPNEHDKLCYHFLIDKNGKIYKGRYAPENNEVCKIGHYAAHTGGGNTGAIGVSMCAMAGFKNKNSVGHYPITKNQFEATMRLCAELCKKYKIEVTQSTVFTHYEFGKRNPNSTSAGKIDIIFIPPYPWVAELDVGSFIRSKIKWYLTHI
ncbi:MAG: N-acetylmuramoyl-L-alanine amidase [Clostridiaceae bacterium]|jgi:N-acetyl-anhydromuramyl-L-alanine amidase AmpD|nr:N-acetylmuramoyl-L-alanine amidase [Clostridiaceae bacterium]